MKYLGGFLVGLFIAFITYVICISPFGVNLLVPNGGNDAIYAAALYYGPRLAIGAGIIGFIVVVVIVSQLDKKKDEPLDTRQ